VPPGRPEFEARKLPRHHHEIYRRFWTWLDRVTDCAVLVGWQQTVFRLDEPGANSGILFAEKQEYDSEGEGRQ
jgi:hypothetical protein